jgi:hypothetical protein
MEINSFLENKKGAIASPGNSRTVDSAPMPYD